MNQNQISNPYVNKDFATTVELFPDQIDSNYYLHLKKNIEKKIIGKCNNIGLFTKIIKLTEYDDNMINPENFTGNSEYKVKFVATICIPIINTIVVLKIKRIIYEFNDYLIYAENGPITCIMATKNNSPFLSIESKKLYIKSKDKYVDDNTYVKVLIKSKRIDPGDKKLNIGGIILDLASEEEVKNYFYDKPTVDEEEKIDDIQFNEDNDYNETVETNNIETKNISNYSDV